MGLQIWPPSNPVLSSMACLDVESPSICRVLQHCLQQRRTREQLVEQGIMPPLKTPAAFHKQIRSLERARTGNFLKHKLCSRPERSELVRMHILEETQVDPSLHATQMKLKRARLADDLNEKISQRPGPMELVEKKILPVESDVEELIKGGKTEKPEVSHAPDVYSFDEDSSDASSPQQLNSQESPGSVLSSPKESGWTETSCSSSNSNTPTQLSPTLSSPSTSDVVNLVSTTEQQSSQSAHQSNTTAVPAISTLPVLVKQSLAKPPADKSRSKKSKEPKPRMKKLKYHQYIPPDQKQELREVPMDSSYSRLLQQQQQFLHLQILSQQQQQYNRQVILPVTLNISTNEVQTSCSAVVFSGNTSSTPVQLHHTNTSHKSDHLPANLDEMKVAELKMELKLRSLPVSGTKTDLIERLRLFQKSTNSQCVGASEKDIKKVASQPENIKSSPPVSLIASKVSKLGIEDINTTNSSAKLVSDSPTNVVHGMSSPRQPHEECPTKSSENDTEKDKRLHEKERQIEELRRKLEQEQKLVEELKMQLEEEKRSQQSDFPPQVNHLVPIQVKKENVTTSSCSAPCSSSGQPLPVKQEESVDHNHVTTPDQMIISHQTITQAETLQSVEAGAQLLLHTSLPASAVELLNQPIELHTAVSSTTSGHIQTPGQVPQKTALRQQSSTQTQQLMKTWTNIKGPNLLGSFPVTGSAGSSSAQTLPNTPTDKPPHSGQSKQTKFTKHVSESKDPPRYEEAVKQIAAAQGPSAASQQMDDLFDVLIASGEISPFTRQNPPGLEKTLPVTASVTTLPINTVLSRPPPLVQVAQLPAAPPDLTSGNELETFLTSTLVTDTETRKLKLMEKLNSPGATMEVNLSENMPPSSLNLQTTSVDNMDWLDLTLSVPTEGINPLDMSVPEGVFSSDFLDSHELNLNWD